MNESLSPKRAVIYTRVSRDDTGEGRSNDRQEEQCRKLADLRGWEVVDVQRDISISAYGQKQRPAWNHVLAMVEAGEVDVVIANHVDRITRNMIELEELITATEAHSVGVATVVGDIDFTSDAGRMVARILGAVARQEVERKGARQRLANKQRATEGHPWPSGFRPFGYTHGGDVIEEEAALIRQAADDVLQKGMPLREVARQWRESGISTPRVKSGKDGWTHRGVKSVLLNPRMAGWATYKGEIIGEGVWEPILEKGVHTELVAMLRSPDRLTTPHRSGRRPVTLLSGIALCSVCDGPVQGGSGYKGKPIYQCRGYHVQAYREEIDDIVVHAFAEAMRWAGPGEIVELSAGSQLDAMADEARTLQTRLTALGASHAAEEIDDDAYLTARRPLLARKRELEELGRAVTDKPDTRALKVEQVRNFRDQDFDTKRRILTERARITLFPRGGKGVPVEEQVTVFARHTLRSEKHGVTEHWEPVLNERSAGRVSQ